MPKKSKKKPKKRGERMHIKGTPIPTPRLLLAIDAAGAAGVALFYEGVLVGHTPADGTSFTALLQTVAPLIAAYVDVPRSDRVVVLEQHWMNFHSVAGSMTLGQRRGIAQSVGEALGCTRWYYVPSNTWQSYAFHGKKPVDTKLESLKRAKEEFGIDMPTDDCSDAALLGQFFLKECCLQ